MRRLKVEGLLHVKCSVCYKEMEGVRLRSYILGFIPIDRYLCRNCIIDILVGNLKLRASTPEDDPLEEILSWMRGELRELREMGLEFIRGGRR